MAKKKKKSASFVGHPDGGFIEFGVETLAAALALLKPILLHRATRKDLRSYHFTAWPDGRVTISARDERSRLQLRVDCLQRSGTGTVMIDAHALNAMMNSYGEPRVRIHLDDAKDEVRFEGLAVKCKLPAFDPDLELKTPVPGCTERSGWSIEARDLVEAINMTKGFVDEDSQRYALGGLCLLLPEGDEGPAELVSCDGRRLARVRVHVTAINGPKRHTRPRSGEDRFWSLGLPVIPIKAVLMARRIAQRSENGRMALAVIPGELKDIAREEYEPGQVQIVTPEAVLTADCESGRFPNYVQAMPDDEIRCRVRIDNASRLASLLAVATASTNSESRGVDVVMAGGCIMLNAESNTRGKSQLSLTELEMDGQGTFVADALYFRQVVDCLGSRPLTIDFRKPSVALVFSSGMTWDGLLMPLSRDEEPQTPPRPAAPATFSGTPEEMATPSDQEGYPVDEDTDDPEDGGNVPQGGAPTLGDGPTHVEGEEPEDEPVVPVVAEPAKVETNCHGKPSRNGRKKK